MAKIFYDIGLAEKMVTSIFGPAGKLYQSPAEYELSNSESEREGRTFLYMEGAEIEFEHNIVYGELEISIVSITNEFGFVYDKDAGGNKIVAQLFCELKYLLESDDDFCTRAFSEIADYYYFDGLSVNDPDGQWQRVN